MTLRRLHDRNVLSVRLPVDVSDFLDTLPNKSAFIATCVRRAVAAICPHCRGTGKVLQGGEHGEHSSPTGDSSGFTSGEGI